MNCKLLADLCPCFHQSPTKLCPDLVSFVCWIVPGFWPFTHKGVLVHKRPSVSPVSLSVCKSVSPSVPHLVVEEDGAARLQSVLVHKREDADVVLAAHRRRHDRVVVIDDLLERADRHRCAAKVVHFRPLLLKSANKYTVSPCVYSKSSIRSREVFTDK